MQQPMISRTSKTNSKMTDAEIKNTSLRVQYWPKRIQHSQDVLQPCKSIDEAVRAVNRGKKPDKRMSPMDIQCLKHAIEVSPIRCPLTESTFV